MPTTMRERWKTTCSPCGSKLLSSSPTMASSVGSRRVQLPGPCRDCGQQRKARLDCDVVFRATDGVEVWAHRFVMWHKFSGCCALFDVAKESRTPDQKKNDLAGPPVCAVIKDLEGDMVEELVEYAYYTPLHERIGLHNVVKVLELAETLNINRIRAHCLMTLKHNLEPENCISVYHLACSRGYENLASSAHQYLVRNFDKLWKDSAQFEALTPEEMRTILEDDRLHAPSEVEDTFKAILKWISADVTARKMYLAKFLPLVRFVRCGLLELEYVRTHPEVDGDVDIQNIMHVINQTLTEPSMAVGEVAGIDLSPKLWLTPRLPKDILFLFGGWAENAPTNEMLTYNNRSHKWRNFGNQSTVARAYHDAAVIDSRIYFVGGFSGNWVCNTVACFDVLQATWSVKAKMAYHRCYVSVAVLQASTGDEMAQSRD
ncbi:hypothetical protein HPB52_010841 [Rhipicephalus sanguineus]|uniref:BACK domain-containing protein n=1 Tax=Rhipicephalus sanguineus TaxID=34632 RepID=A0A9D4T3M6_RHISA|nr:hypothetical protein HPB52_010841 [Rhipicephalus sanguineus]